MFERNPDGFPQAPGIDFLRMAPGRSVKAAVEGPRPSVELLTGTSIQPAPVDWIWQGWLAASKLHLIAGAPGTGKTTIAIALAAIITRGLAWPDGEPAEPGDVVIWSGEDDIADTLLPRFLASGGDPRRLHVAARTVKDGEKSRPFDPANDIADLAQVVGGLPAPKLIILDPVVTAVTGDSHKNTETRRGLQPVVDLAVETGCAVLGVTHLSKNSSGREPLDRVTGSVAFGAVARVVLATVKPADPDAPRRLVRAKSNLGPDTGGFEYRLFGAPVPECGFLAQRVEWGQPLEGSARELMEVETPDNEAGAVEDAETWLAETLAGGPVPTRELKAAAQAHGHSWRTVRRAQDNLQVKAVKLGLKEGWAWQMPPPKVSNPEPEDAQQV